MLIEASLETSGLAPADVTHVTNGIREIWSGKRAGVHVEVRLNVVDAPVVELFTTTGSVGQGGSSGYLAGGQMSVPVGQGAGVTRTAAAHEFGHVMGLSHDQSSGNLMNPSIDARNPSNRRVTAAQIQQAIKNCATAPADKRGDTNGNDQTGNHEH